MALDGHPGEPFIYKSKGALASLGAHRGVAEVYYGVRFSGLPAWLLWRGYYLSFLPGFATKMRVAAQWLLDSTVGRSTVPTGVRQGPGTRYVRYRTGDRVFEEGNRADGFYAVVEGAFEVGVRDPDGRATLRRIGPGGHFGERVLLGEGLRTGTVRALEDSVVLVVGAEDFRRMTQALPPLRAYFDRYVSEAFQPMLRYAG